MPKKQQTYLNDTVTGELKKFCRKCNDYKVLNEDNFYKNPRYGFSSLCKIHEIMYQRQRRGADMFQRISESAVNRAKHEGLPYDPWPVLRDHLEKLYELQGGKCFYSDVLMTHGEKSVPTKMNLEKLNPKDGYVVGNVVLCCFSINVFKSNRPLQQFLDDIESINMCRVRAKEKGLDRFIRML